MSEQRREMTPDELLAAWEQAWENLATVRHYPRLMLERQRAATPALLRDLKAFAEAHHGDEDPNMWLHGLTIDVPARIDAILAALPVSERVCGCRVEASWPGNCPACGHREHGMSGCKVANPALYLPPDEGKPEDWESGVRFAHIEPKEKERNA